MSILLNLFFIIKIVLYDKISSLPMNDSNNFNKNGSEEINNNTSTYKRKLQDDDGFVPIKIYFDTYFLTDSIYKLNQEDRSSVLKAINKVKFTLESLIKVRERNYNIDANEYKQLLEPYVKETHDTESNVFNDALLTGNELDVDLVIYVDYFVTGDFKKKYNCNEFIKIFKSIGGKPIIGYMIINPKLFENVDDYSASYLEELYSYNFLHQATHILGFTDTILHAHISTKEIKRNPNQSYIKKIISTENLMNFAEKYFNCPRTNISGIELEELEEYSGCDEYIHWDSRILSGDYMTSELYVQDQVISEFTLILLNDTGYYRVNLYTGGLMRFGKNAGCDFFNIDCNEPLPSDQIKDGQTTYRKSLFPNEFCAGGEKTTCSPGRQSRGVCENYIISEKIADYHNNFYGRGWNLYGNKYADFCPLSYNEMQISDKLSYIGNCKMGNNNFGYYPFFYYTHDTSTYNYNKFSPTYGEKYSNISFCAFSSVIYKYDDESQKQIYKDFIRPTCYEMYCSNFSLTIRINEQYIVCPRSGGYISIGGDYIGHLLCPDYNLICSQSEPCNNMFDCVEKKSTMKLDYKYDYETVDASMTIILPNKTEIYPKAYEIDDYGKCPKNCSECNQYRQCFECNVSTPYYLGEKEGDLNPIT